MLVQFIFKSLAYERPSVLKNKKNGKKRMQEFQNIQRFMCILLTFSGID